MAKDPIEDTPDMTPEERKTLIMRLAFAAVTALQNHVQTTSEHWDDIANDLRRAAEHALLEADRLYAKEDTPTHYIVWAHWTKKSTKVGEYATLAEARSAARGAYLMSTARPLRMDIDYPDGKRSSATKTHRNGMAWTDGEPCDNAHEPDDPIDSTDEHDLKRTEPTDN